MSNAISSARAVKLGDDRCQRQQQAVPEQNGWQPNRGTDGNRRHICGAVRTGHNGVYHTHCGL